MKIELQEDGQLTDKAKAFLKAIAVVFSYEAKLANNKGSYFNNWIKHDGLQVVKELLKGQTPESVDITPEALRAAGFKATVGIGWNKDGFSIWPVGDFYHLHRDSPLFSRPVYTMPELLKLMEVHAVKEFPSGGEMFPGARYKFDSGQPEEKGEPISAIERGKELEDAAYMEHFGKTKEELTKDAGDGPKGETVLINYTPELQDHVAALYLSEPAAFYCYDEEISYRCEEQCENCKTRRKNV